MGRALLKALEVMRRNTRVHFTQPLKERIVREVGCGLSLEEERWQPTGISAMPLSFCYLKPAMRRGLILEYGGANADQIRDGVNKLRLSLQHATG